LISHFESVIVSVICSKYQHGSSLIKGIKAKTTNTLQAGIVRLTAHGETDTRSSKNIIK